MVKDNLSMKLLTECLNAVASENDMEKGARLFKRYWNNIAQKNFAMMESEDGDVELSDMGDNFTDEIAANTGDDKEELLNQAMVAVGELEEQYPSEMTEEVRAKFDDLRNAIDELRVAEEGDETTATDDALVVIEDLKSDFDIANALTDEVTELFDEISNSINPNDVAEEETEVIEVDKEDVAENVDLEAETKENDEENIEASSEEVDVEAESDDEAEEEHQEHEEEDMDLIFDLEDKAKELVDTIEQLKDSEQEEVKEGWENVKLPRNKLQSEEDCVCKKGMKFPTATVHKKKELGITTTVSAGKSADVKPKVQSYENKGAKSWTKVAVQK